MGTKIICKADCKFNKDGLCRFNEIIVNQWHECMDYQPLKEEEEDSTGSLANLGF